MELDSSSAASNPVNNPPDDQVTGYDEDMDSFDYSYY